MSADAASPTRSRLRRSVERHVRAAWTRGPGPLLRGAAGAYGAATALRNLLYDAGALSSRRASVPVLSVGGLTAGGSGKTPLAAELARWLADDGIRVGLVTPGETDEAAVHARLEPRAVVVAERDRWRAVGRLVDRDCRVVVLDSGFQHRRLARDLDLVALDAETMGAGERRRLPAGPFREGMASLGRAHGAVIVRRAADPAARDALTEELRTLHPDLPLAACRLSPGPPEPANRAAREAARPEPAVALAGVMHAETFLRQAREVCSGVRETLALGDHHRFSAAEVAAIAARAGGRGVLCTLKDAVKLEGRLPEEIPLWYLPDRLRWELGEADLRERVRRAAGLAHDAGRAEGGGGPEEAGTAVGEGGGRVRLREGTGGGAGPCRS